MFYRGKHEIRRKRSLKMSKATLTVASIVLLVTFVIGGTVAWIVDRTEPVTNQFKPSEVSITVNEDFDGKVKSNVVVQNTGDTSAYVRARVIVNWVGEDNNIYPNLDAATPGIDYCPSENCGGNWEQDGGYWYYKLALAPGAVTCNLIDSVAADVVTIDGKNYYLQVEILAEAIQSTLGSSAQAAFAAAKN